MSLRLDDFLVLFFPELYLVCSSFTVVQCFGVTEHRMHSNYICPSWFFLEIEFCLPPMKDLKNQYKTFPPR